MPTHQREHHFAVLQLLCFTLFHTTLYQNQPFEKLTGASEDGSYQYVTTYIHPEGVNAAHNSYDPGLSSNNVDTMSQTYGPSVHGAEGSTGTYKAATGLIRQTLLEHNISLGNNHSQPVDHSTGHAIHIYSATGVHPGINVMDISNFAASPELYCPGQGCLDYSAYHERLQTVSQKIDTCTGGPGETHAQCYENEDFSQRPNSPESVATPSPIRHAALQEPLYYNNTFTGIGAQFYEQTSWSDIDGCIHTFFIDGSG